MKKIVISFLFFLSFLSSYAQKDFQGMAVYESKTSTADFKKRFEGNKEMTPDMQKMIEERMKKMFEKTFILNFDKQASIYKEEDTVVPRYVLPELLSGIKRIGEKYGFKSVCYGHAGDGNLHVNIIKAAMSDDNWNTQVPMGIREIFELTVSLKGTLSGEHGIGYVQKNFMDIAFSKVHLELMERIKHVFDPNNILNPGKIFPDDL